VQRDVCVTVRAVLSVGGEEKECLLIDTATLLPYSSASDELLSTNQPSQSVQDVDVTQQQLSIATSHGSRMLAARRRKSRPLSLASVKNDAAAEKQAKKNVEDKLEMMREKQAKKNVEDKLEMMREKHAAKMRVLNLKEQLLKKKLMREEFRITTP